MQIDVYTKAILTVIAAALLALTVRQYGGPALAQGMPCGDSRLSPCLIEIVQPIGQPCGGFRNPCHVRLER